MRIQPIKPIHPTTKISGGKKAGETGISKYMSSFVEVDVSSLSEEERTQKIAELKEKMRSNNCSLSEKMIDTICLRLIKGKMLDGKA